MKTLSFNMVVVPFILTAGFYYSSQALAEFGQGSKAEDAETGGFAFERLSPSDRQDGRTLLRAILLDRYGSQACFSANAVLEPRRPPPLGIPMHLPNRLQPVSAASSPGRSGNSGDFSSHFLRHQKGNEHESPDGPYFT